VGTRKRTDWATRMAEIEQLARDQEALQERRRPGKGMRRSIGGYRLRYRARYERNFTAHREYLLPWE
jgi:hypothetical protein